MTCNTSSCKKRIGVELDLRTAIRKVFQRFGYDIVKCEFQSNHSARLMKFLADQRINLVFDIGANTGQSGDALRQIGYQGRIVSFEPLSSAFAVLQEKAQTDPLWTCEHLGLSDKEGKASINVSRNSQSSSLLDMMPLHAQSSEASSYIGKEEIELSTVDSMMTKHYQEGDRTFLKIDSQGYERVILEGAGKSSSQIWGIELEMSFVPLYKDAPLFSEMDEYLGRRGYALISIEPVFFDPKSGQLLQANGLYSRIAEE